MILRPVVTKTRADEIFALFEGFDEDFIRTLSERDNAPPQECEAL